MIERFYAALINDGLVNGALSGMMTAQGAWRPVTTTSPPASWPSCTIHGRTDCCGGRRSGASPADRASAANARNHQAAIRHRIPVRRAIVYQAALPAQQ
jgi:hypothetical protein